MLKFLFTILLLTTTIFSYGQTTITDANENYEQKIADVYGANFFNNSPSLYKHFVKLLSSRISYLQIPKTADEKHPLISANGTLDKYGTAPSSISFNKKTFNPLFYNLNFFSKKVEVYRVDGTDYLLVIKPQ